MTVLLDTDPALDWERVSADERGDRATVRARPGSLPRALSGAAGASTRGSRTPFFRRCRSAAPARTLGALKALSRAPAAAAGVGPVGLREYPVLIGHGLLAAWGRGELGAGWPLERPGSRRFCVSDETVWARYGECRRRLQRPHVEIAPGEQSKTLQSAERVWRALLSAGMTRADHVLALGGGVVGDLAGLLRGDLPARRAGGAGADDAARPGRLGLRRQDRAWTCPRRRTTSAPTTSRRVCSWTSDTLATFPPRELAAGWVEVLKTALIAGGALWERVAAGGEVGSSGTILACARAKLAIVAADERDGGARQALNLGHTVGHAIETATGYSRYRHGEAVGLGLLAALRLSGQEDLRTQARELLLERGLPVASTARRCEAVLEAVARDKKRLGANVPFVLLEHPGEVRIGCEVAPEELRAAVMELAAMTGASYRVEVMHGVNLDQLGRRDPLLYGTLTLARARAADRGRGARRWSLRMGFFHSNHEGAFIEHLHGLAGDADAILLNPGRVGALRVGDPGCARDRRAPDA